MNVTGTVSSSTTAGEPRAWLRGGLWLLGLAIGLATVLVQSFFPRLTAEERQLVGHWYGYLHDTGEGKHYAWLAEERRDRTCRITFRNFWQQEDSTEPSEYFRVAGSRLIPERAPGASSAWLAFDQTDAGTWRCVNGRFLTRMDGGGNDRGLLGRWAGLLAMSSWQSGPYENEYVIQKLLPNEVWYDHLAEKRTFHAVRVPADFTLPEQPTTAEAVRARLVRPPPAATP